MWIGDCVEGIDMIMHCDELVATPINLGSHELVSINELLSLIEDIAGFKVSPPLRPERAARASAAGTRDNTMIRSVLGWEPSTPLRDGMAKTYAWIEEQYNLRKSGKKVVL